MLKSRLMRHGQINQGMLRIDEQEMTGLLQIKKVLRSTMSLHFKCSAMLG